jgi:hypothetical protein
VPTYLKVILIICSVLVLAVGGAAWAGYHWYQAHGREFVASVQKARADGDVFAATADNETCVKTGVERYGQALPDSASASTTLSAMAQGGIFLSSCLKRSKPTPGFCAGVPPRMSITLSKEWSHKRCAVMASDTPTCSGMMQQVQNFCRPRFGDSVAS